MTFLQNIHSLFCVLQVMPTLAWCFVADGLTAVQGGVLRGAGEVELVIMRPYSSSDLQMH